ncbi:MAG: hypothetical protein MUC96_11610 [Myxococcaceae bacterium]|nr:hypothetical protein [Myxococcaceae bacterium]
MPLPSPTGGGAAGGLSPVGGGPTGTGGGAAGGSSGGGSSVGGGTGGGGGGAAGQTWTAAACDAAMDKFASANCPDSANWLGLKTAACAKLSNVTSVALCATAFSKAQACQAQFISQAMLACTFGGTDTNDTCGADVVLGALCAATVNTAQCAGVQCRFNTDCPSGWTCNDQTDRCVNTSARCPGLPCRFNTDCPTGFTCNDATGQCNAN